MDLYKVADMLVQNFPDNNVLIKNKVKKNINCSIIWYCNPNFNDLLLLIRK